MDWLSVFEGFLGGAETLVPVFIHNAESKKIEGVVVTQANNLVALLAQLQAQHVAPGQTPTGPPVPPPTAV